MRASTFAPADELRCRCQNFHGKITEVASVAS